MHNRTKNTLFRDTVALISSLNEDGETNLAPISSFWALGWTAVLGLADQTKTAENIRRHPECAINLPNPEMWPQVERLAPLTGKNPVPEKKVKQFHYRREKFDAASLTPMPSELVRPARVKECPVQMEARVRAVHFLHGEKLQELGGGVAAEVEILRVHVTSDLVVRDHYVNRPSGRRSSTTFDIITAWRKPSWAEHSAPRFRLRQIQHRRSIYADGCGLRHGWFREGGNITFLIFQVVTVFLVAIAMSMSRGSCS